MAWLRLLAERHPLRVFFLLAFGISWTCQIVALLLADQAGLVLSNEDNLLNTGRLLRGTLAGGQALPLLIFSLGAGPLLAGFLTSWLAYGRAGVADLWRRTWRWRLGARWYAIIFAIPAAIALASLALGWLAGGMQLGAYAPKVPLAYTPLFFLFMLVFTGLAEEPGWRGFALPHLQRRYSAEQASWILGALWGVWHYPFLLYFNRAAGLAAIIPVLVLIIPATAGWSIVNTWLYNNTESVFAMIVLHGWWNTVASFTVLAFPPGLAPTLNSILPWALAIYLLKRYGKQDLAAHPRPQMGGDDTFSSGA